MARLPCKRVPMAFDPILRWPQDSAIPRDPGLPEFLQAVSCAYADDFAVAASTFRTLMVALSPAVKAIDHVAGLNLKLRTTLKRDVSLLQVPGLPPKSWDL